MRKRINVRKDHVENEGYSNWCDLPQNFKSALLFFLSPKSRCVFKATCKSWKESELLLHVPADSPSSPCHSSPTLIRTELRTNSTTSSYECYHPMTSDFFRLTFKKRYCRNFLKNAMVHYSSFGWLLMSEIQVPGHFFFFNPFTKHKIDYVRDDVDASACEELSALHFTSSPTSSDRQVVSPMFFERYKHAHEVFDHLGLPEVLRNHHLSPHNSLVFHRGLYYFLVAAGVVGVSLLEDEYGDDYIYHDTRLFECGTKLRHSFLIEVDGRLLGIFDYQGVRVLWLDIEKWEWNPVGDEDLRDKILYVSYKGSFVQCDATTKGVGNKIYFPAIIDGGGVYYSLDTRKYHTPSGELDEIEDYGNSMTWITPPTNNS